MSGISRQAVLDACGYFDGCGSTCSAAATVCRACAAVARRRGGVLHGARRVDESTGEPLTTGHLFRIASHSKTFTATAVMQLVERGDLRLDDTVGRSSSPAPARRGEAPRTDGARGWWCADGGRRLRASRSTPSPTRTTWCASRPMQSRRAAQRAVRVLERRLLPFLGQVIEAASGQTYQAYVAEHVVGPLGLVDTGPTSIRPEPIGMQVATAGSTRVGACRSTTSTPVRDVVGHASSARPRSSCGTPVRTASAMTACWRTTPSGRCSDRVEVEGTGTSYGLGLRSTPSAGGGSSGTAAATRATSPAPMADPVDRLAVSVFTNAIDGPALGMAKNAAVALVNLAADQHTPTSEGAAVAGVDPAASADASPTCGRLRRGGAL
ncbi:MAG: serine hydrolase [Ilumatobacteraceae bacterium]